MGEIENKLKELTLNYKKNNTEEQSDPEYGQDCAQSSTLALKIVYEKFEKSIDLFNKEFGSQGLFVENLSVEIFKLLLNFEDINACFFLRSRDKLVFVFNEGADQITFFGKYKSVEKKKVTPGFVQLFKIKTASENSTAVFKDNTGRNIGIEEVIIQVIRWLLS